jgi:hypothetical protein
LKFQYTAIRVVLYGNLALKEKAVVVDLEKHNIIGKEVTLAIRDGKTLLCSSKGICYSVHTCMFSWPAKP